MHRFSMKTSTNYVATFYVPISLRTDYIYIYINFEFPKNRLLFLPFPKISSFLY